MYNFLDPMDYILQNEQNILNTNIVNANSEYEEKRKEEQERIDQFNFYKESFQMMGMSSEISEESEFRLQLKKDLLAEALFTIFDKAVYVPLYENRNIVKKHLISKFINENDINSLLDDYSEKSYLLSEMTRLVLEYTDIISEKANVKDKGIDPNDKEDFYNKISEIEDFDYINTSIKFRVSNAINQFNTQNSQKKRQIENINLLAREKLNNNLSDEIKEFNLSKVKKEEYEIRNNNKTVLESMVLNVMESAYKNEEIKNNFFVENKIDIDRVIDHCTILYGFLEMMNTLNMYKITPEYIQEQVNSLKV